MFYEQKDDFVNYLKTLEGGSLVKRYCTNMHYAWDVVEKISEKHNFKLIKSKKNDFYQCLISDMTYNEELEVKELKEGYAESELPSMAICLAIIDFFDKKDDYIEEAEQIIKRLNEERAKRIKELEKLGLKLND